MNLLKNNILFFYSNTLIFFLNLTPIQKVILKLFLIVLYFFIFTDSYLSETIGEENNDSGDKNIEIDIQRNIERDIEKDIQIDIERDIQIKIMAYFLTFFYDIFSDKIMYYELLSRVVIN